MNTEIKTKLEQLAIEKSFPFCYNCYTRAVSGRCRVCHSDDLMREMPTVGVEYGTEFIVKHILETELSPVDTEEAFEQSVRDCYPETVQVLWMNFDAVTIAKEMDPVSWDIARSEWESQEEEEGNLITFDGGVNYYALSEIEDLVA